jgi:hypothetical protein
MLGLYVPPKCETLEILGFTVQPQRVKRLELIPITH